MALLHSALQLIAGKDPDNPEARFEDHVDLHIEARPAGTKLEAQAVFSYLVAKGLFRIGVQLSCTNCRMVSWIPVDTLEQRVVCELCGHEYDATRQLVSAQWHYRRSGVLGAEKNAQGAVPVVLTLQQLETNLWGAFGGGTYSPSLELESKGEAGPPKCELDFVWMIRRPYPRRTVIILGECKDQGTIDADAIDTLRQLADAFPRKRFKAFVLLAKLSAFSEEEIERAKTLNKKYEESVILLTARELEPYHFFDRAKAEGGRKEHGGTPEDLAAATVRMYFTKPSGGAPDASSA